MSKLLMFSNLDTKANIRNFPLIWNFEKGKTKERDRNQIKIAPGCGLRDGIDCKGGVRELCRIIKMFYVFIMVVIIRKSIFTKIHWNLT